MFNEKSKVQINGSDVLPFCKKKEKEELMFIFYCVCIKYHCKIQRRPQKWLPIGRRGEGDGKLRGRG